MASLDEKLTKAGIEVKNGKIRKSDVVACKTALAAGAQEREWKFHSMTKK